MVNVNKNEISDNFENYFITLKEKINQTYLNTNESNENVLDILKIYEKKVLFDILYLSPKTTKYTLFFFSIRCSITLKINLYPLYKLYVASITSNLELFFIINFFLRLIFLNLFNLIPL